MQDGPTAEGAIFVQSLLGGLTVRAKPGREIRFGRNRPEVHVCVGEDDPQVSRLHGMLVGRLAGGWELVTTGRTPIRLPDRRSLFAGEEPYPIPIGYSALVITGTGGREHLLEVRVTGPEHSPAVRPDAHTHGPRVWSLDATEHLALVALARRYLQHEPHPAPQSWRQVAAELDAVQPTAGWTHRRVEHLVAAVRARLSAQGVRGLTREEWGDPVGNALNESLVDELLRSTTLTPTDLVLLDDR